MAIGVDARQRPWVPVQSLLSGLEKSLYVRARALRRCVQWWEQVVLLQGEQCESFL